MLGDISAVESGSIQVETPVPSPVSQFTTEFLAKELSTRPFSPSEAPVDPNRYSLLFHTPVSFDGKTYELVYKASRPRAEKIIAKLSLIEKDYFDNPSSMEEILSRSEIQGSATDASPSNSEVAYRTIKLDLDRDPIEARSKVEVMPEIQGKGLGTMLFNQGELLISDMVGRVPDTKGRSVAILVLDVSEGWARSKAKALGYEKLTRQDDNDYRKIIVA